MLWHFFLHFSNPKSPFFLHFSNLIGPVFLHFSKISGHYRAAVGTLKVRTN